MPDKPPPVLEGGITYSGDVAQLFLPRHEKLQRLHGVYADKELQQSMRQYVSRLLRGWTGYLQDDEVVVVWRNYETPTDIYSPNGKQAKLIFPHSKATSPTAISYNFVSSQEEPEAKEIALDYFETMNVNQRAQLLEHHPEILRSIKWEFHDGLFSRGLLQRALTQCIRNPNMLLVRRLESFLSPEQYVSNLDLSGLITAIEYLIDDTDIYYLTDGKRKGEVCLACKRVDP